MISLARNTVTATPTHVHAFLNYIIALDFLYTCTTILLLMNVLSEELEPLW